MEILEPIAVTLIVMTCTIFSAWRLMSARIRLRLLDSLAGIPANAGGRWLAALRQKTLGQLSGGCGTCSRAPNEVNATVRSANRRPAAPRR